MRGVGLAWRGVEGSGWAWRGVGLGEEVVIKSRSDRPSVAFDTNHSSEEKFQVILFMINFVSGSI